MLLKAELLDDVAPVAPAAVKPLNPAIVAGLVTAALELAPLELAAAPNPPSPALVDGLLALIPLEPKAALVVYFQTKHE